MSKLNPAFVALAVLLLSACGTRNQATVDNGAGDAESNAVKNASPADSLQPGEPANPVDEPAPPPDAVSHPDGYLPPAPGEPDPKANSSATDTSPPTTEDEYMRNRQAGR